MSQQTDKGTKTETRPRSPSAPPAPGHGGRAGVIPSGPLPRPGRMHSSHCKSTAPCPCPFFLKMAPRRPLERERDEWLFSRGARASLAEIACCSDRRHRAAATRGRPCVQTLTEQAAVASGPRTEIDTTQPVPESTVCWETDANVPSTSRGNRYLSPMPVAVCHPGQRPGDSHLEPGLGDKRLGSGRQEVVPARSTGHRDKDALPVTTEMTVHWAPGAWHSRQGGGPQALGGTNPRKGCAACQASVMEQSRGTQWP